VARGCNILFQTQAVATEDEEIAAPTAQALLQNGVSMPGGSQPHPQQQQQQQQSESPLPSKEQTQWDFSTPISLDDGLSDDSDFNLYYYNDYLSEDAVKGARARQSSAASLQAGVRTLTHGQPPPAAQQVRTITEGIRTPQPARAQRVFMVLSLAPIAATRAARHPVAPILSRSRVSVGPIQGSPGEPQQEPQQQPQQQQREAPTDIPGQQSLDLVQWDFSTSDSLDDGLPSDDFFYYSNDPMFMDRLGDAKLDGDIPITVADKLDTDQDKLSAAGCAHCSASSFRMLRSLAVLRTKVPSRTALSLDSRAMCLLF
jgi:hypothetical protein